MILSVVEFAAQRRGDQDEMEKNLFPIVSEAMQTFPATNWYNDLLSEVTKLYLDTYHREGGTGRPHNIDKFVKDVRDTLEKTKDPNDTTVDRVSVWLATAILNAATQEATGDDQEFLVMEWVTMHDEAVRPAHRDTEGQQRPPGEPFDVDGVPMRYPGDPTAPIELWINCRCTLAPVLGTEAARGGTMTASQTEAKQPITAPDTGIPWHGVLAPEGVWSGDKRQFEPNSLVWRDLPLPLTWQKMSDDGHKQSVTVASIERIERRGNLVHGSGVFMGTPEADEAIGLIAHFGHYGVSVDADQAEAAFDEKDGAMSFSEARVSGASIVGIPAFAEAFIQLGMDAEAPDPDDVCDPQSPNYDQAACEQRARQARIDNLAAFKDYDTKQRKKAHTVPGTDSYPIEDCEDLKNAIQAIGRAKDPAATKKHIKTQKSRLGCPDVSIPEGWADETEEMGRGPGWVTNPEATRRIHSYWTKPGEPGFVKINWGVPGDFNRCRVEVGQEIAEEDPAKAATFINQICAQWHYDALGYWPGRPTAGDVETLSGDPAPAVTLVAGGGWCAPSGWFADPGFAEGDGRMVQADGTWGCPLTVTDDGRVFGHLAKWGTCHTGFDGVCTVAPHSNADYAYFLTGSVDTDAGPVAVGNITLDGPHAPHGMRVRPAMAHYDNTCAVVADVACGEDDYGIWVAGAIRPGITDERLHALKASGGLSGDWRKVNGRDLELIAALAVNSGGFPVPRVGWSGGEQTSLVAAGCVTHEDEEKVGMVADASAFALAVAEALKGIDLRREKMKALFSRVAGDTDGV